MLLFQSTPPVRGATSPVLALHPRLTGFNPRPPCGERRPGAARVRCCLCFNPRPPCGERLSQRPDLVGYAGVSIHAPRAGSDSVSGYSLSIKSCFNPRPPCGERRHVLASLPRLTEFQSTPPVRGATSAGRNAGGDRAGFNPRPPCGERRPLSLKVPFPQRFQSTPPVRGATGQRRCSARRPPFQSTPPVRGATCQALTCKRHMGFNPRPPCGERLVTAPVAFPLSLFQSTPPVRGATWLRSWRCCDDRVSIHAPRAGSDVVGRGSSSVGLVSIHAPRAGSDDLGSYLPCMAQNKFQSTPPVRGATTRNHFYLLATFVSIHAPRAGSDVALVA